jgi:hypothetical protein
VLGAVSSMNVTIIFPSSSSFLAVFSSDATRPLAASLNWVAGQAPTPNAVTAALSADGKVSFYNLSGTVNGAAGAQFGRLEVRAVVRMVQRWASSEEEADWRIESIGRDDPPPAPTHEL